MPVEDPSVKAKGDNRQTEGKNQRLYSRMFKVTVTNPCSAGGREYSQAMLICPDLEYLYQIYCVALFQKVQGASNARTDSPYATLRCQGPQVAAGDQRPYTKHSEPRSICYLTWDGTE